ncbi:MAG: hypothetical protein Q8834_02835, partial [Candidatus Phytoplasma australasiaticum]|nr:hypothetical protein [Candidatus Phytoplasma australasiaticum]
SNSKCLLLASAYFFIFCATFAKYAFAKSAWHIEGGIHYITYRKGIDIVGSPGPYRQWVPVRLNRIWGVTEVVSERVILGSL